LTPFILDRKSPSKSPTKRQNQSCLTLTPFILNSDDSTLVIKPAPVLAPNLLMSRKQNGQPVADPDLNKVLEVDAEILSYGKYISGRILGSQLTLTNHSSKMRSFTLQINSDAFKTSGLELL